MWASPGGRPPSFREAERGCKSQLLQREAMKNPSVQQAHSASTLTPGHLPQTCWGLSDSSILPLAQAGEGDLFFLFPCGCGPPHGQETLSVPASQAAPVPVTGKPLPRPGRAGAGWCNSTHEWAQGPGALALTPESLPPVLSSCPQGLCVWGELQGQAPGVARLGVRVETLCPFSPIQVAFPPPLLFISQ